MTGISPLLPAAPGINRLGIIAIGLIAVAVGIVVWQLPWERWQQSATLALVPLAFTLISFHNYFGGSDPYRFGLFFMVAFVGLGIAHPQWSCVKMSPLFIVAYLAPFFMDHPIPWDAASSVVYAAPVCLLVGESLSWVSGRLRRAQIALRQSEARFRSLVQNASDIVLVVDPTGVIQYLSPSEFPQLAGLDTTSVIGRPLADWIHPEDAGVLSGLFSLCLSSARATAQAELRYRSQEGSWRYAEAIANNLIDEPSVSGIVITAHDIHHRKILESQLTHQALHDSTTGLANLALFNDRLRHALERSSARGGNLAVLFINLDQFKVINDSLGHHVGDELLVLVSHRLLQCVRDVDTLARMGGDQFTLLLEDLINSNEALNIARHILAEMRAPYLLAGREVTATASIGITFSNPRDMHDVGHVLRRADVAMFRAKARGRDRFVVFDPSMELGAHQRLEVEQGLRGALERNEFVVHYQPEVALETGEEIGKEALIRWHHPRNGLIMPTDFIPVAEETGLVIPIGEWALQESCQAALRWERRASGRSSLVSVNISGRQLLEPNFCERVAHILSETGYSPANLLLEITESAVMEETSSAVETFAMLKRLGVQLAIDDFGTGYSSLSYLKLFPVDFVKIDRSFVSEIARSEQDAAIVGAIIDVAHSLGLQVIAEGVESIDQITELKRLGCDIAQGYFYARPEPDQRRSAQLPSV